jgi:hypothetical protein
VRFDYYERLSRRDKAIYRASDERGSVPLPDARALAPIALEIARALEADDRILVEKLTQKITSGICKQLGLKSPGIRVMAVRPKAMGGELYGLYVRREDERPELLVWMRTAARRAPVASRTYLRTLFHEICHHLDYELFELAESFHTKGFFRRESSLMRQIVRRDPPEKTERNDRAVAEPSAQLVLALPRTRI